MKSSYYYKLRDITIEVVETSNGRKYYVFDIHSGEIKLSNRFDDQIFGGVAGSETDLDELTKEEYEEQVSIMRNRVEMNKKLPIYCVVASSTAIKVINRVGRTGVLIPTSYIFNVGTHEFEYNMSYRSKAYGEEGEVRYLSKEEFDVFIETLKCR